MFRSVFVLSVLFVVVGSQDGQDLKPQNLSLEWVSGFQPQLSWAPPLHSMGECTYEVSYQGVTRFDVKSPWTWLIIMEGGSLKLTLHTECNGTESDELMSISHPELVSDLHCYVHAPEKTHCSWLPSRQAPDLKFFYRLLNEDFRPSVALTPDEIKDSIQECPSYTFTDDIRTGCDLEAGTKHSIQILFNGTVNNMLAWNTFKKSLADDVRPPALNVTVTKIEDKFNVNWTRPDVEAYWQFKINYTVCEDIKIETADNESTFKELNVIPECPSCISVKAEKVYGEGQTPWSEPKCFVQCSQPVRAGGGRRQL